MIFNNYYLIFRDMFGEFEIIADILRIGDAYAKKKTYLFTMS